MLFTPTADHQGIFAPLMRHWRAWQESRHNAIALDTCGGEAARIARDLSLTTGELRSLARKGADAAELLYRRIADLGLERDAIAYREAHTLRDMQRACSLCASKGRCRRDFARGAAPSAWRDYCPNDDTLDALAARDTGRATPHAARAAAAAVAADDRRGRYATLLGMVVVGLVWLLLVAPPPGLRTQAPLTTATVPTETCLDTSCLSPSQQAALRDLRAVQARGLVASPAPQRASLAQSAALVQAIAAGEAAACARRGGSVFRGFMYQNGCTAAATAAAQADGFGECLPMAGGGVCLIR
jgi:hypothetical protein